MRPSGFTEDDISREILRRTPGEGIVCRQDEDTYNNCLHFNPLPSMVLNGFGSLWVRSLIDWRQIDFVRPAPSSEQRLSLHVICKTLQSVCFFLILKNAKPDKNSVLFSLKEKLWHLKDCLIVGLREMKDSRASGNLMMYDDV